MKTKKNAKNLTLMNSLEFFDAVFTVVHRRKSSIMLFMSLSLHWGAKNLSLYCLLTPGPS